MRYKIVLMFKMSVTESYPKVKLDGFEVSVPNSFFAKVILRLEKPKSQK